MLIKMIKGWVTNWGAPVGWDASKGPCGGLPARIEKTAQGAFWVSSWELEPKELEILSKGGTIHLGISATIHPVGFMRVEPLVEDE